MFALLLPPVDAPRPQAVILPLRLPHMFAGKLKPSNAILLYGPPGTGKTLLAKALAHECHNHTFISVSSSSLVAKWGEPSQSGRLVKELFEVARERAPTIIFVDELDSLCGESDASRRIKAEFLAQMRGTSFDDDGLLFLGTTSVPWLLDSAICRRFQKQIYIPLPQAEALTTMFKIHMGKTPSRLMEPDYVKLGKMAVGRSGADVGVCVQDAIYQPMRLLQSATHFKEVKVQVDEANKMVYLFDTHGNPDSTWPLDVEVRKWESRTYWTPCSPHSHGAVEESWTMLEPESLMEPPVSMSDMERAMHRNKATVNGDDLKELEAWTAGSCR